MRAVVYTRISQDRTGLAAGVTRQLEECERRCRERGWSIAAHRQDNDISAAGKRKRPGFDAMLSDITTGTAKVVVAWSLDRLQRNRRDELRLYEACREHNAVISLVNGAELDFGNATGRLVADHLGSLARFEIELKSDRQIASNEQAAKAGKRTGGRRPFGYEPDGVEVREAEAQAVRDGYGAVLAGVPLAEIAREWNRRGFVTGQARWKGEHAGEPSPWRRDSVRAVLLNPRYAGYRVLRDIVAPAVWTPLVDDSTFDAVKAVLTDEGRRRAPMRGVAMLTGIGLCGRCGAPVHAGGSTTPGVRNYRCSGGGPGGHVARRAQPVDDWVDRVIVARLSRADAQSLMHDTAKPDLERLRGQALAIRSRLDTLATEFADGSLTGSQLRAATERARENLAAVEAQMADAARMDVLAPLLHAGDVAAVWAGLSSARKRAVVDLLAVVTIHGAGRGAREFNPDTVRIEWRQS